MQKFRKTDVMLQHCLREHIPSNAVMNLASRSKIRGLGCRKPVPENIVTGPYYPM